MAIRPGSFFSFPNPVNEIAARSVAGGVLVMALVTLLADLPGLLIVITYGFWARVATGPTASPLGQLATRVVAAIAVRVRQAGAGSTEADSAQGIGAVVTSIATITWLHRIWWVSQVLLGLMIVFAFHGVRAGASAWAATFLVS